jgi:hypothetical protein
MTQSVCISERLISKPHTKFLFICICIQLKLPSPTRQKWSVLLITLDGPLYSLISSANNVTCWVTTTGQAPSINFQIAKEHRTRTKSMRKSLSPEELWKKYSCLCIPDAKDFLMNAKARYKMISGIRRALWSYWWHYRAISPSSI